MTEEIRTEEIRAEEESEGTEEEVSGINESAPEKGTIIEIEEVQERVVLVGVSGQDGDDTEDSVAELAELVKTAGATVVAVLIQNREKIPPGTYVGTGKVAEIAELIEEHRATGIVCDDELSPAQMKNLEQELDTKVMDRTLVILDIFAAHATTSEGRIQVELAQLKYRLGRLAGFGRSMSRLGGGIGTRGPGEKKLEMDRRLIRERIAVLGRELKDIQRHRQVTRARREKHQTPVAAIVGYTNAGKSTLLNHLTGAGVMEADQLFATLDPTTRTLTLPGRQEILLTDTVGFIRKLPHHLIEAFRSTLEEARYADYILHVVDASSPQREKQMQIVYATLYDLGIREKTVVTLFNKQDLVTEEEPVRDFKADYSLSISAKEGSGTDALKELLGKLLRENKILVERTVSYADAAILQQIRKQGELLGEEYREDGIFVRAYVPMELYGRL